MSDIAVIVVCFLIGFAGFGVFFYLLWRELKARKERKTNIVAAVPENEQIPVPAT